MNLGNGKGSMSTASSSGAWRPADSIVDQFPAGLRVLVVDDDPTCLLILEKMLRNCLYEVTECNRAESALSLLRENKNGFDIVISDVHMPDMDGFKLLEHIGLEMDLPVIMMSADDGKNVVMKGVTHGACDYLIKPVRIEALRNIWQHVVRRRKNDWKDVEQSGSVEEGDRQHKPTDEADYSSSANEGSWRNSKRRKDEEDEGDDRDDTSTLKKPRVVWSVELHQQFVAAVNQLGIDKAVPKKISELMNVPGLSRENVASHLQKYRLYLRRLSGVSQHQSRVGNSFLSPQEAASFGSMSSLNGIDLQALAVAGQLPSHSLAMLQAAGFGSPATKSSIPMPLVDQRNLFSFENPKLRFGEGQQQHMGGTSKQMNLLHGIPTNMEPKQLASLQQSAQSFGNMNMQVNNAHGGQGSSLLMQMAQLQPRGQLLNEATGNHIPRLPSSVGQPMLLNNNGAETRNGIGENSRGVGYKSISQTSALLNYPIAPTRELPGSSFPLGSAAGIPKGPFQEEVHSDMKGSGGFTPSYNIFSDLQQHKSNEWELHNIGLPFDALQGNIDVVSSSGLIHQGFSSGQRSGQNMNPSTIGNNRVMFSAGEATGIRNANIGQHHNNLVGGNSIRVKTELFPETSSRAPALYHDHFGQDELMSAFLKQQQEGLGPSENEFDFDGYSMDNIPV